MGRVVNRQELADILGYSLPTISAWIEAGVPVVTHGGRGKAYEFNTEEVVAWLLERERNLRKRDAAAANGEDGEPINIDRAKLRKELAQARQAELNLAKDMDLVKPVAMIAKVISDEIANARQRLLSIPNRLRPHFQMAISDSVQVSHLVAKTEELVREAMLEIRSHEAMPTGVAGEEEAPDG
ncbi:terminase small subunit [Amorphus sp. MBR-141]